MKRIGTTDSRAFTLIEMIFASLIAAIVIFGLMAAFLLHRRTYHTQQQIRALQQNVRFAVDSLARDVRMAGYGFPVPHHELTNWCTWVPGLTSNPALYPGTTGNADVVTIAAAFDPPRASLTAAVARGATTLPLLASQGALFDTATHRLIYVDRVELARILAIDGDNLTISTDATEPSFGLQFSHPAGSPIELVTIVSYSVSNAVGNPPLPGLMRSDTSGTQTVAQLVAAGIEDLRAGWTNGGAVWTNAGTVRLTVRGRTEQPCPNYLDPVRRDRYQRMTATTVVAPRNPNYVYTRP